MKRDYRTKEELKEIANEMNLSLEDLLYKMVSSAVDEIKKQEIKIENQNKIIKEQHKRLTNHKNINKRAIKRLERKIKIKDAWAQAIIDCLYGYDGYENSITGLRGLVDEAMDKANKIIKNNDKSIVYSGHNGTDEVVHENILGEKLTKFTKEDKDYINSDEYKKFWGLDKK